MKKNLVINTVLYFILYSISLSAAWFELGLEFPTVDGVGFIWLFPVVYLVLFLLSLRSVFTGSMTPAACLRMGFFTLGFISVFWGISVLLRMGGAPYQPREIIYPAVLFIGSAAVFALSLVEYVKAGKIKK